LVIATNEDPQRAEDQIAQLTKAGAIIFRDLASTIDFIASKWSQPQPSPTATKKFREPLAAINVGIESFYESLKTQGAKTVQVDWRPPAAGNEDLMDLLQKMKA